MATSEEILNQFGSDYSSVNRNVRFKDLEFSQLEKELSLAQKSFKEYDKAVNKAPQFSSAQSDAINQRDLAMGRILSLSVILTSKAQSYAPVPNQSATDRGRSELALANKYKKFDLNRTGETTHAWRAARTERGGPMNPIGAQLLPSFKKGNFFVPAKAPTGPAGPTGAQGVTGPTGATLPVSSKSVT